MNRPPHPQKAAVLRDYLSGYSGTESAARNGVSASTAHKWITASGISRSNGDAKRLAAVKRRDEEFGLTGGRWVLCRRTRVQRWEVAA